MERLRPYRTFRAPANEFGKAEAGPSTQVPLPIPYVGAPTPQPPGGVSATTADAINQPITEEDRDPVSYLYCPRIPHVTESASGVR